LGKGFLAERVGFYANGAKPREFAVFLFVSPKAIALGRPCLQLALQRGDPEP
jgi:hypothetical protein